ncbi:MAG TPA: universal stress protein [Luteimonas sp.]|nr:universal stress protein [Luteimonas sp.]
MGDADPGRLDRILLATDLSARCDRALDRAVQLAAQWQATLLVVHAVRRERGVRRHGGDGAPARLAADPLEAIRQRVERDLGDDVAAADIHVEEGEPADVILDVAARERCGLVVLGDAREAPAARLHGGTIDALLRRSPGSLLVVKRRPRGAYRRVLVGTDLTPESMHGLDTAAALFPQAAFTLLHALDIPYESLWLDEARRDELVRMEAATIEAFADRARLPAELRRGMQLTVEHGHPEAMLRKRALERDHDLTVIGAFRRGLAFHLLVGGTTSRIVQAAPTDVLVVRAPASPGERGSGDA